MMKRYMFFWHILNYIKQFFKLGMSMDPSKFKHQALEGSNDSTCISHGFNAHSPVMIVHWADSINQ